MSECIALIMVWTCEGSHQIPKTRMVSLEMAIMHISLRLITISTFFHYRLISWYQMALVLRLTLLDVRKAISVWINICPIIHLVLSLAFHHSFVVCGFSTKTYWTSDQNQNTPHHTEHFEATGRPKKIKKSGVVGVCHKENAHKTIVFVWEIQ